MSDDSAVVEEELVPDDVIPHQSLPPLKYRDLPAAISWKKMIGPSIMLAGLSLGSGEFVLWPYITYKTGFIFFWACLLGVMTQFFMNMEIERWTLVTGESAITGFCRLNKNWAWIMLLL
ncbi:MAG: Nramp family divalent metal transporter, partial [Gimesia chilikensis]